MSRSLTHAKVISFASGKGGVGKTSLVANMGSLWARQGKNTLLIDGDWSLGKLGIAMGVRPRWTIEQVLGGEIELASAVTEVSPGLSLLASPSGVLGFEELTREARAQLFFELEGLNGRYDLILLDHSSGVHGGVMDFAAAAHQHLIVTTSEPTSYTDAYAIMKVLSRRYSVQDFRLVVTMSHDASGTQAIMEKFMDVAREKLGVRVKLLDILSFDPRMSEAIRKQTPFVKLHPLDGMTGKLERLCRELDMSVPTPRSGLSFFYSQQLQRA